MTKNGVLYLPAKYSKIAKRRNFGVTKIIDFGSCATVYTQVIEAFLTLFTFVSNSATNSDGKLQFQLHFYFLEQTYSTNSKNIFEM